MTPVRMGSQHGFVDRDILIYVGEGTMGVHDVHAYHRVAEEILAAHNSLYVLADISGAASTPPESRRLLAQWADSHRISGVAVYGGSASARALAMLILRAILLVRRSPLNITFTKTEQDAREWVAAQRSLRAAAK